MLVMLTGIDKEIIILHEEKCHNIKELIDRQKAAITNDLNQAISSKIFNRFKLKRPFRQHIEYI